jgi:hypothetical protein
MRSLADRHGVLQRFAVEYRPKISELVAPHVGIEHEVGLG